jgi:hypothetical protein
MADEAQVLRGIDWREAFPFTHIFRSFRIAIHLSKLALGLALLLSIYFGGRILDGLWPSHSRAVVGEVTQYEVIASGQDQAPLKAWREQTQKDLNQQYAQTLISFGIVKKYNGETDEAFNARVLDDARNARYLGDVKDQILKNRDQAVSGARSQYDTAIKNAQTADARTSALHSRDEAIADAYAAADTRWREVTSIKGDGLFAAFFDYEVHQVNGVVDGVKSNNWLEANGVKDHVYNFFAVGPVWLIWNHAVFFVVFAILFLLSWALFGGAISRIAAVHVARDEKISVRQAMNFAVGKLLSFASAPVIPLVIVIFIGLFVTLVALIGNIPFLGPIVIGLMFLLALLAGFVMTLVLLGTAGGLNLMYPTIAVEGSDSFDAISRSFSYIYARPWRMLFYTTMAVAYGAATYLFVHMFIWLTLVLTHHFVGMGIFTSANNTADLFSTMWPNPMTTGRLSYSANYEALSAAQRFGAFFINCWVMLLVSFLGAFAISLYFSANTIVYYLMRAEVDSTEMDDVYLEQSEEELEPALSGATATVTVTTEASSPDADAGTDSDAASTGDAPTN